MKSILMMFVLSLSIKDLKQFGICTIDSRKSLDIKNLQKRSRENL